MKNDRFNKVKKMLAVFTLAGLIASTSAVSFASADNSKDIIPQIVSKKIDERVLLGFSNFNGLHPGKYFKLKDQDGKVTKYLVELEDTTSQLSGYMVVDLTVGRVIEFALGTTHPLAKTASKEIFYLGPVSFAEDLGNESVQDLNTKRIYSKSQIKQKTRKYDSSSPAPEKQNTTYAVKNITDYDYDFIPNVPDYIQADNTEMENDCVPTSGANVLMFWRANGYTALSSSNNWKNVANRLGVIMGHTDADGVSRNNVVSGLTSYISEKGYSADFSVSRDTSPTFAKLDAQVEKYHPAMLSVNNYNGSSGGHNITLVGTESYYDTSSLRWVYNVIVHDNWASTPDNVWFEYSNEDIDDIYKINEI